MVQGEKNNYKSLFRQKIQLSYNLRKTKLEPSVSYEYFYGFSKIVDKTRFNFSLAYPIYKKLDFALGLKFKMNITLIDPLTLYIFESKLIFDL